MELQTIPVSSFYLKDTTIGYTKTCFTKIFVSLVLHNSS